MALLIFLGNHAGKLVNLSENIYASTKTRENAHTREVMRNEAATLISLYPSLLATAVSKVSKAQVHVSEQVKSAIKCEKLFMYLVK